VRALFGSALTTERQREVNTLNAQSAASTLKELAAFFSLTFLLSWMLFWAAAAVGPAPLNGPLYMLGVFTPSLVGLGLTALAGGGNGIKALLGRILAAPRSARWYVFALGYMAAIKLASAVVYRIALGAWPTFGRDPLYVLPLAILVSTPVQAGEEIGWRGYALPRLASRLGLGPASILLGVLWAAWHWPFFVIPGVDKFGQSFPVYLASVTPLSVAFAWLYWRTQGSLLSTMLLHAAVNNTTNIVPSAAAAPGSPLSLSASPVAWIATALLWSCAAFFLVQMRRAVLRGPDD